MGIDHVDPLEPIPVITAAIQNASVVLSESMHGAIVADAYRVPWVPIRMENPDYSSFKWEDWCASVEVPYAPSDLRRLRALRYEPNTLLSHLKSHVDLELSRQSLRRVLRHGVRQLSDDATLDQRRSRLLERIELFNKQFLS
jgi:succinoglycan biosynthesis protein ExoV